jgi:uncharacterized protein
MKRFAALVCYLAMGVPSFGVQSSQPQPPQDKAETGHPLGQFEISQLRAKAEGGDTAAQTSLGMAYQTGTGVPQDYTLAIKWFHKAADQGSTIAENNLGLMYRMGEGVAPDKEEAVRWYKKAARQGSGAAMFNLGAAYYNGDGVEVDDVASQVWFILAEQAGESPAREALHRAESEEPHYQLAAFKRIAQMYEAGDDLPKSDLESLKWYRKAADAGDRESSVKVASLLLARGRQPTPEEFSEARDRCAAAAKVYSPAAYCMVVIYRNGLGVEKNPAEEAKWLHQAADLGHAKAALELGEAYWKGMGVRQDLVSAYMWVWLALTYKVPGAKEDELALRGEMKPKEVEAGKQRAYEWLNHFKGLRTSAGLPLPATK